MNQPTRHEGTSETMPWILWSDAVLAAASVGYEESEPHRARMQLWYRSGEPVWMAADSLRAFVRGARLAATQLDDREAIREALRAGIRDRGAQCARITRDCARRLR